MSSKPEPPPPRTPAPTSPLRRTLFSAMRIGRTGISARPVLSAVITIGLAVLIATWVAIPLYAEGAAARLLDRTIDERPLDQPPFSYLFSWSSLARRPVQWSDAESVDRYLLGPGAEDLGLPVKSETRFLQTPPFTVFSAGPDDGIAAGSAGGDVERRGTTALAEMSGFFDRVEIDRGRVPTTGATLEGLLSADYAEDIEVDVGDTLILVAGGSSAADGNREIELTVSGIWRPGEPTDEGWLIRPETLQSQIFVTEGTIADRVDLTISTAQWFILLERGDTATGDVERLIEAADRVTAEADDRLAGTRRSIGPIGALEEFQRTADRLATGLRRHSSPFLAITAWFVLMVANLAVGSRRTESAVLRSRGASIGVLIGGRAVEAAILATLATVLGVALAYPLAAIMSRTRTFLDLSGGTGLASISPIGLVLPIAVAWLVAFALHLAAALPTVGQSIVDRTADRGRASIRPPWWQRRGLDIMFVVVLLVLARQVLRRPQSETTLLDDPLVVLLPALLAVGAGLLASRLVPRLMQLTAALLQRTDSVAALLATRQGARSGRQLVGPLVLLTTTVALAVFSASLARTIDLQTLDEAYHRTGADAALTEIPPRAADVPVPPTESPDPAIESRRQPTTIDAPLDRYRAVAGVDRVTRIEQSEIQVRLPESRVDAGFLGIDVPTFGAVAFWRDDYAPVELDRLLGRLAATPEGVLVPDDFARANGLGPGSTIELRVGDPEDRVTTSAVVAGTFHHFPTWIPSADRPLVVGNAHFHRALAGPHPGPRVLIDLEAPSATIDNPTESLAGAATTADLRRLGVRATGQVAALSEAERRIVDPGRQGVFGVLTAGFALSASLTVASFATFAVFTFRRRTVEVGIVRAMGMSERGLAVMVGLDLIVLAVAGAVIGVAVGGVAGRLFIPGFATGRAPSLVVTIASASASVIVLGLFVTLVLVMAAVFARLRRQRAFESIKLGETL